MFEFLKRKSGLSNAKYLTILWTFFIYTTFLFSRPDDERLFDIQTPGEYLFKTNPLKFQRIHPKPYVTCFLSGQLGNQLFEIAATLAHAWDNGAQPLFPELKRKDLNIPLNWSRVFFRLDASPLPRPILNQFRYEIPFSTINIPYHHDQLLFGFFQSWEYFHHHRERILEIFAPSQQELDELMFKHADILNHPKCVGIHVRTFNQQWDTLIPFVGLDYYERAMNLFPDDALFVVFSDRINWCKNHFKNFNKKIVFIENQDHVADFYLMSLLKHNIIGNSSYSWWAAYLNQNPDKLVVAPDYFVRPHIVQGYGGCANKNLPEWKVLNIDLNLPYPADIKDYDSRSKSIDTQ